MAAWLEPLKLETIFMNIFAGDPNYFMIISLLVIASMAGFFRMTTLGLFFMLGLFLFMFSEYTASSPMLVFFTIIAGLIVGYVVSRLWDR